MAEPTGLEPATSRVTGERSSQLNYDSATNRGAIMAALSVRHIVLVAREPERYSNLGCIARCRTAKRRFDPHFHQVL